MISQENKVATNNTQREYYNERYEAYQNDAQVPSAGLATKLWWNLRDSIYEAEAMIGIEHDITELHKRWLGDITQSTVLDLGCFTGNPLSMWLAERSARYRGFDLSEKAVTHLNKKLCDMNGKDASAIAGDILDNDFPDGYFDIVYAKSVLHHFNDIAALCSELTRMLKPGGIVVSDDPLQIEPINRMARAVYRPFQSDRSWEWPFTTKTLSILEEYFEIVQIQGTHGLTRLALPLLFVPVTKNIGVNVGRWGWRLDKRFGKSRKYLYVCWNVTMMLRTPL